MERPEKDFIARKTGILAELATVLPDKSPKGDVDTPIIPLLKLLNRHPDYVTTSSCSGRVAVYADGPLLKPTEPTPAAPQVATNSMETMGPRKEGQWLMVSHSPATLDTPELDVANYIFGGHLDDASVTANNASPPPHSMDRLATFKFEPLIIHIQARTLQAAKRLLDLAIDCGFRNSGLKVSDKRYMIAVRSSLKIDAPIATVATPELSATGSSPYDQSGLLLYPLVSQEYLRILLHLSNAKFLENQVDMDNFECAFSRPVTKDQPETKEERRIRKRMEGLQRQNTLKASSPEIDN
ncbi:tRNA wybutosine-synthesizing protein [Dimargaris cristalligena]|uniref:tRNA wybutosine-synthesizing protein 3 n=1 Tax=Dimargaris cristalligena TaxID=215637 RepID=A0A4P9ZRS5_9FUNG|nr:tRNA wybutosine-synthesizing protein [Dimargaris cristalligena]|eukprot:RKP35461.1 tRNA wybutosine-synthesizing protein [Dimargaris cristalligena]